MTVKFIKFLIRIYQLTLSQWLGMMCRYQPTCSEYALAALDEYGPGKGLYLTLRRVLCCQPFGGSGYDPVPRRRNDID